MNLHLTLMYLLAGTLSGAASAQNNASHGTTLNFKKMKSIETEVFIEASPSQVWQTLTDLPSYGKWNPLILKSTGTLQVGERLRNEMESGGKTMVFKPKILEFTENKSFIWRGSLPIPFLFTGVHYFKLVEKNGGTQLIHGETFQGLLRAMVMKKIGEETLAKFHAFNQAIKERIESNTPTTLN